MAVQTPYDELSYPGHPYQVTHPDHLAALGTLYGMTPAARERCRVLELGCGVGGNILPMAYGYPDAEFVGVDLSAREIEIAVSNAARFGVRNVSLHHADIADVTEAWGRFDYIIAHGVYSWVSPEVREAMLTIFGRNLSPQGIVYVSYNAHPGSHLRNLTRDIMNFHVREIADTKQRILQARAILKFVSESSSTTSVHGAVLRDQYERVAKMRDEVLFHDDLNANSTAFTLHEVATDAARQGLQYLCDATLARRDLTRYSDAVREVLGRFPDTEYLARDQLQDFIDGHGFRRTLLCRADIPLHRTLDSTLITQFHLACSARPVDPAIDPHAAGPVEFKLESNDILATDHVPTKVAFNLLGERWPLPIAYEELAGCALASNEGAHASEDDAVALRESLFTAALRGYIGLHLQPGAVVAVAGEFPEASFLARKQAEVGMLITNLQHEAVLLEDERVRRLLLLVDGTRNRERLLADLKHATADLVPDAQTPPIDLDNVEKHLRFLARLALLVK